MKPKLNVVIGNQAHKYVFCSLFFLYLAPTTIANQFSQPHYLTLPYLQAFHVKTYDFFIVIVDEAEILILLYMLNKKIENNEN